MKSAIKFINVNHNLILLVILAIGVCLRFTNYNSRWGLAYDQAHDVLVARYALQNHKIPLLGPFSSAGPFQTGGQWYWFIMAASWLNINHVITPWIILTLCYCLFIYLMYLFALELSGNFLIGLIAASFTAVSQAQISQGLNLTNQSPIPILSLLVLWSAIRYFRTGYSRYLFFLGLITALASLIHLQGVSLFSVIIWLLIMNFRKTMPKLPVLLVGIFVSILPLLIYDSMHNYLNITNMFRYILSGQNSISYDVLGRRWLTFLSTTIPNEWVNIVGGYRIAFLIVIAGFIGYLGSLIKNKKNLGELVIISFSLITMIIIARYTKTPLFSSYFMTMHPFIFLISAYSIYWFVKTLKIIGIVLLLTFLFISLKNDIVNINNAENNTLVEVNHWVNQIKQLNLNSKISLYDLNYNNRDLSLPLVLFLDQNGLIDDKGIKIGLGKQSSSGEYQLFDLSSSSSAEIKASGWAAVNPSYIFKATEEWMD
jgi:hypothetical protein